MEWERELWEKMREWVQNFHTHSRDVGIVYPSFTKGMSVEFVGYKESNAFCCIGIHFRVANGLLFY